MKKQIKIGFDMDGVTIDFNSAFLSIARNKFDMLHGITYKDVVCYDYCDCLDISEKKCFEIVDYVLENPIECKIKPIEGATKTLTALSKHTDLLFVTARQDRFAEQTKYSIYSILPDVNKNKIKIIHSKGSKKHEVLRKFGVKYFVDDKLTTCITLKQQGICPILYSSPWNQSKELFFRVNSWNEISKFIFKEIINEKINY